MRDGIVTGMQFNDNTIETNCVVCAKAKHAVKPFQQSTTQTKGLLEIVHSDLCGPMEITSIGRAKYFMTFIDDYSRKVFLYF